MKNFTDITVLVDRSGSMQAIKEGMEGAFRTFLKEHKKVKSSKISLIQFDDINNYQVDYLNVPIEAAENLVITPRGNTPLLDAMCKSIDATGERFNRMSERERPSKVLFIVITDGQENSSKEFKRRDVFDRVTRQTDKFNWQFVYLGANQDTFAESQSLGFNWGQTLTYTPSPLFVGENSSFAQALAVNTVSYSSGASKGVKDFTEGQRAGSATTTDRAQESNKTTSSGLTSNS